MDEEIETEAVIATVPEAPVRETPTTEDLPTADPATDWDAVSALFPNRYGIRPKRSWFKTGLSERMGAQRLQKLTSSPEAGKLDALLSGLSARSLRRLHASAKVNAEQAQGAFRATVFLNVTFVIAVFMISNQLAPGWAAEMWGVAWRASEGIDRVVLIGAFLMATLMIGAATIYGYGGVAASRDLLHLMELHMSGMEDGRLDTSAPADAAGPVEDLRSVQLTDF